MEIQKKNIKKPGKKVIIIGSMLLLGIISGIVVKANQKPLEEGTKLREYTVTRGNLVAGVEGGGKLSLQQESFSFEGEAAVGEIHVKEGQSVKAGDPLASISPKWLENRQKELEEALKKAEYALDEKQQEKSLKKETDGKTWNDTAAASRQKYESERQSAQSALEQLQNSMQQKQEQIAELEAKIAELTQSIPVPEEGNQEEINSKNQEIESLNQQVSQLRQEVEALNQEASTGSHTISTLDLQRQQEEEKEKSDHSLNNKTSQLEYEKFDHSIEMLVIEVEKAKKELEQHKKLAEAPTLFASSDGIVLMVFDSSGGGQKDKKEGEGSDSGSGNESVVPKGTTLVTVGDVTKKQAQIKIPQEEITKLQVGQIVNIEVTAFEERVYTGKIAELNLKPNEEGENIFYTAIVDLDETTDLLLDGMSAYAQFILKEKKDVLILSNKAIRMKDGKQFVKIKMKDETQKEVEITTGFSDGSSSEILSGLKENDIVVVEG